MVASDSFAEFLCDQLAPLGHVTLRRMFGKAGVFCDGVMLGLVSEDTLYVRVDDQNRAIFKEAESAAPLSYAKQGVTIDLAFWPVPERLFDEPDELVIWARAGLAAARRVAAKRKGHGGDQGLHLGLAEEGGEIAALRRHVVATDGAEQPAEAAGDARLGGTRGASGSRGARRRGAGGK